MILSQYVGDYMLHYIPMRWNQESFTPAAGYFLTWTLKASLADTDALAKRQKVSALGLTESGSTCILELLPVDTGGDASVDPVVAALDPGQYYWDIQAQSLTTPTDIRTVASGTMNLIAGATKLTETAVDIFFSGPALAYGDQVLIYSPDDV